MRLDKYICDAVNMTRTQAKTKISKGCVTVDGVIVKSSSYQVNEKMSIVVVDGRELEYNKYVYIMMNKPKGVLSAAKDKKTKTAIDLLAESDKRHDLFIAGRLDKDTTGFLLITNDGDFAHSILSPKKHVFKKYLVTMKLDECKGYRQAFEEGITLEDGYKSKPAVFEYLGNGRCTLEISEGKFHQVKRMFCALGNEVVELCRISMGGLELDSELKSGEYRYLTAAEVKKIMGKLHKKEA